MELFDVITSPRGDPLSRLPKTIANTYYRMLVADLVQGRLKKAFSQYDVAREWGRDQSIIAKIETFERRLDLVEFVDLCVILDIDAAASISRIHEHMRKNRVYAEEF